MLVQKSSFVLSLLLGISTSLINFLVVDAVDDNNNEKVPLLEILPEYINHENEMIASSISSSAEDMKKEKEKGDYYVFLQKFPLYPIDIFFHTEVLVCDKKGFSTDQVNVLEHKISTMKDFAKLDKADWSTWSVPCVELGYGGADCDTACCSVPHHDAQKHFMLNAPRAVIGNADTSKKELYLYGHGDFSGNQAFHDTCDHKCWSSWKGTDYNPITNNCNTFTSTVLKCVYGLSEKKPDLSVSDMVDVKCAKKSCQSKTKPTDFNFHLRGADTA